jgi:hypothetical protein
VDNHDSFLADGCRELLELLWGFVMPSSGDGLEDEAALLEVLGV